MGLQPSALRSAPYRRSKTFTGSPIGGGETPAPPWGTVIMEGVANGPFIAIDHVQLAMPRGGEGAARAFFVGLLGMTEIAKPVALAGRGGCWFASGDVQVHLGVEDDFLPTRKAHPALRCGNYTPLVARLRDNGFDVTEANDIQGVRRCHVFDPFGNRIELIDGGADTSSVMARRPDSSV